MKDIEVRTVVSDAVARSCPDTPPRRFRIRAVWTTARTRQRRREFGTLFGCTPDRFFGSALELGGGDGFVASIVARYCGSLVTTDSFRREPAPGTDDLRRLTCCATSLPFSDASFDLIFSSSVLEHLPHRELVHAEIARCLRPGGLVIHVMPTQTWKLLQLIFYYPHIAVGAIDLGLDGLLRRRKRSRISSLTPRWSDAERLPPWRRLLRSVVPPVHGEFPNHAAEWRGFSAQAWTTEFVSHGFIVGRTIPLPLYSGYGFGLERLRALGERFGLSSHTAFALTRLGDPRATVALQALG